MGETYIDFKGSWVCYPTDWETIVAIRVTISESRITTTYLNKEGKKVKESHRYAIGSQDNGQVKFTGAPFSVWQFKTAQRLIISRRADHKLPQFDYIFSRIRPEMRAKTVRRIKSLYPASKKIS